MIQNKLTLKLLADGSFDETFENIAKAVHNRWMTGRIDQGWKYGPTRDDQKKEHPGIVPFAKLPEEEKEVDRQTVKATLTYLLENGYEINKK